MTRRAAGFLALWLGVTLQAQEPLPNPEMILIQQEQALALAIRRHDDAAYNRLLSASFFYTSGQDAKLRIASKTTWGALLRTYDVASFDFDDARVRAYDNTGVVTLLATERAKVSAVERTTQYFITDIWIRDAGEWRLAERHSSRPGTTR